MADGGLGLAHLEAVLHDGGIEVLTEIFFHQVRLRVHALIAFDLLVRQRVDAILRGETVAPLPVFSAEENPLVDRAAHAVMRFREQLIDIARLSVPKTNTESGTIKKSKKGKASSTERKSTKSLPEILDFDALVDNMFTRKMLGPDGRPLPFCLLTAKERKVLRKKLSMYERVGRLININEEGMSFDYGVMREGHIASSSQKAQKIQAHEFRKSADHAADTLVTKFLETMHELGIAKEDIAWISPWRSALVLARAAKEQGIDTIAHLGVRRDHATLDPITYYERIPADVTDKKVIVVADPMLATGGTSLEAAEKLLKMYQGKAVRIVFMSMFAAPEGVARLLKRYPNAMVFTGALDQYLNERGYIVSGLGDFGDRFSQHLSGKQLLKRWQACLNAQDKVALLQRTDEIAKENRLAKQQQTLNQRKKAILN